MRKLNVLNANREPVGLDTVIYTNKTIDEVVYIDSDGTEVTLRMIHEDAYVFVTDPSAEKQAEWQASYDARSTINKETYTIREVLELNLLSNGFFDNSSEADLTLFNGGTIKIENGRLKYTTDSNDAYCGVAIMKSMIQNDDYYVSFRGYPAEKDYVLQTMYTYNDLITVAANQDEGIFSTIFNNDNASTGGIVFRNNNVNTEYDVYFDDIILINTKYFDEFMTKERMDYITSLYVRIKYSKDVPGKIFAPSAKTKLDVAYTNKTIDEIEYVGPSGKQYTLRDIFGDGAVDRFGGVNNIIEDGGFDNDDAWGGVSAPKEEISNGTLKLEATDENLYITQGVDIPAGKTCFISYDYKSELNNNNIVVMDLRGPGITDYYTYGAYTHPVSTEFQTYYYLGSDPDSTITVLYLGFANATRAGTLELDNIYIYILDDLFNAGDEPDADTFKSLLDLWLIRKDIKQELTYEEIFINNNRITNSFLEFNDKSDFHGKNGEIILIENNHLEVEVNGHSQLQYTPVLKSSEKYFTSFIYYYNSIASIGNFSSIGYRGRNSSQVTSEVTTLDFPIIGDQEVIKSFTFEALMNENYNFELYISSIAPHEKKYYYLRDIFVVRTSIFDENITKDKMDELLEEYKAIRNTIIEPEVYVVTEPGPGLGGRYKMKSVGDYVIGHEMDFEDISFRLNFGINYPAYDGYNLVREMLKDNKGVIEYDWGKGSRYADVRLLQAPKTEKDSTNLLTNKWSFKMLNPFYKLVSLDPSSPDLITNKNTHELSLKPYIRLNVTTTTPMVELENDDTSNVDQEIRFNFTGVTTPFELIIDCENKKITFADGSNAYGYLNMNYNSFFELIYNTPYILYFNGCTLLEWTHKQWVID